MSRCVPLLFGPEGVWGLIILFSYVAAGWNSPSTPAGNEFLETLWVVTPLVGIPVSFLTAYLPGSGGWSWLMRLIAASSFGVLIAAFLTAGGVDYHDSRNSGLLGAPFYSLAIGLFMLVPGAVIAAIVLWWRRSRERAIVTEIAK
jgi:hypothetical protein